MQNVKLSILATIGFVGLSILVGCQKPSTAPSAPPGAQQQPLAPAGTRWFAVEVHKDGSSAPPTVNLSMGQVTPSHKPDRIVWVSMADNLTVCFAKGKPFARGEFEVPAGQGVLSGPLNSSVHVGEDYPFMVATGPCAAAMGKKDGDVHIVP